MDRRDATHAPMGTLGIAADPGATLVARGGGNSSLGSARARLFGRLCRIADRDDLGHWDSRPASNGLVEANAANSGLGCGSVRHLAHELRTQQHPLARRRL